MSPSRKPRGRSPEEAAEGIREPGAAAEPAPISQGRLSPALQRESPATPSGSSRPEDPIEFLHKDKKSLVNQREIEVDTKSFSSALRSALRQDPDVILVGEMRDYETIETALNAAETGHLVLSTLHTVDATETINRIIRVFPPHQQKQVRLQLGAVLRAVISMRLVPRKDGQGRVPAVEVLRSTPYIRDCIESKEKTKLKPS